MIFLTTESSPFFSGPKNLKVSVSICVSSPKALSLADGLNFRPMTHRGWDGVDPSQYIDEFNVHQILKEAIADLCLKRPQRPYAHLRDYFGRLEHATAQRSNSMDSTDSQMSGMSRLTTRMNTYSFTG